MYAACMYVCCVSGVRSSTHFHGHSPRLVDNLPAATVFKNLDTGEYQYEDGFKIGFEMQKDLFLNNHLHFIIEYHPVQTNEQTVYRIVGFQVEPRK